METPMVSYAGLQPLGRGDDTGDPTFEGLYRGGAHGDSERHLVFWPVVADLQVECLVQLPLKFLGQREDVDRRYGKCVEEFDVAGAIVRWFIG